MNGSFQYAKGLLKFDGQAVLRNIAADIHHVRYSGLDHSFGSAAFRCNEPRAAGEGYRRQAVLAREPAG